MGCGRLFEGTPPQMFDSLAKIRKLYHAQSKDEAKDREGRVKTVQSKDSRRKG